MDVTRSTSTAAAKPAQTVPPSEASVRKVGQSAVQTTVRNDVRSDVKNDLRNAVRHDTQYQRSSGFGMPCSNCRLYYPANLDVCPACNSKTRVSPHAVPAIPKVQIAAESSPDSSVVEQEREAFLKELESKISATPAEVAGSNAVCSLGDRHLQGAGAASICKPCYDRLQERVDVCEAALHMDLKEAAQIIYNAVWADPSDPTKTYTNAASALLSELRKRSGVASVIGPFHPRGN